MTHRSYNQYCGVARALDLVGERWALLVVRELLPGAKRYSDLLAGLPGISTNILAARLQELEETGIVKRGELPPPAASSVYELTALGRDLEEPILALGHWGGRTLGPPTPDRTFLPGWGLLALRASFRPDQAKGLAGAYEFRIDGEAFHVEIKARRATVRSGVAAGADLVVTSDSDTFLALGLATLTPAQAIAANRVGIDGDGDLLARFFEAFRFPAAEAVHAA